MSAELSSQNEISPGPFSSSLVHRLLIQEWYGGLNGKWNLFGDLPDRFDYQPPAD
jgi:hypothetical protein